MAKIRRAMLAGILSVSLLGIGAARADYDPKPAVMTPKKFPDRLTRQEGEATQDYDNFDRVLTLLEKKDIRARMTTEELLCLTQPKCQEEQGTLQIYSFNFTRRINVTIVAKDGILVRAVFSHCSSSKTYFDIANEKP